MNCSTSGRFQDEVSVNVETAAARCPTRFDYGSPLRQHHQSAAKKKAQKRNRWEAQPPLRLPLFPINSTNDRMGARGGQPSADKRGRAEPPPTVRSNGGQRVISRSLPSSPVNRIPCHSHKIYASAANPGGLGLPGRAESAGCDRNPTLPTIVGTESIRQTPRNESDDVGDSTGSPVAGRRTHHSKPNEAIAVVMIEPIQP